MSSKISPKRRRPAAASILDQRKLKESRQKAGLSLIKVQELSGISKSTLSAYENGHAVPPLHRLILLCRTYELDPFEVMELLRLPIIQAKLLKVFRSACKKENTTPLQALKDFVLVYSHEVNSAQN